MGGLCDVRGPLLVTSTRRDAGLLCRFEYGHRGDCESESGTRWSSRGHDAGPARAYVYSTWRYALAEARLLALRQSRLRREPVRVWLYRSTLDGESVWVVSWDPRPAPFSREFTEQVVRSRIARSLSAEAVRRFAAYGPYDARGAALWDAAGALRETDFGRGGQP